MAGLTTLGCFGIQIGSIPIHSTKEKMSVLTREAVSTLLRYSDSSEGEIAVPCFSKIIGWAKPFGETSNYTSMGFSVSPGGTLTYPTVANTSFKAQTLRQVVSNGPSLNAYAKLWNSSSGNLANIWRGNASGLGGFRGLFSFGYGLDATGSRFICGCTASTGNLINNS